MDVAPVCASGSPMARRLLVHRAVHRTTKAMAACGRNSLYGGQELFHLSNQLSRLALVRCRLVVALGSQPLDI